MDQEIMQQKQRQNQHKIKEWTDKYHLHQKEGRVWYKGKALVVMGEESDWWAVLKVYHDALPAGHLGVAKTLWAVV